MSSVTVFAADAKAGNGNGNGNGNGKSTSESEYIDPHEYDGKKIGMKPGSYYQTVIDDIFVDPQVCFFKNSVDGYAAVISGKIDAYINDEPIVTYNASRMEGIDCRKINTKPDQLAIVAGKNEKGQKFISEFNDYLGKLKKSGELKKLKYKWIKGSDENRVMEDYSDYPDTNGTLVIATSSDCPPMEYLVDNKIVGYEIELITGFCKERGYKPDIRVVDFEGIIAGVSSSKYDVGAAELTISEERKESVNFTDSIYECQAAIAVRSNDSDAGALSANGIKDGIKKTFVTESRWKSFASGVYVTLKITVLSIIFGTILGFLVHLICRKGNKITNKISALCRWIIQGMPEVVFLMIAYYIIFGKSSIGGATVAIIVFTLIFGCVTHNIMEAGENSIDNGQKTAAFALGYSESRAFIRIILPQMARNFLPSYLTAVSTHIKATAVVGYIAVVDITKVGDIVRGATYEAFYPLISVAILYFLMAGILRLLIKVSTRNLNPERRTKEKILKGAVVDMQ